MTTNPDYMLPFTERADPLTTEDFYLYEFRKQLLETQFMGEDNSHCETHLRKQLNSVNPNYMDCEYKKNFEKSIKNYCNVLEE